MRWTRCCISCPRAGPPPRLPRPAGSTRCRRPSAARWPASRSWRRRERRCERPWSSGWLPPVRSRSARRPGRTRPPPARHGGGTAGTTPPTRGGPTAPPGGHRPARRPRSRPGWCRSLRAPTARARFASRQRSAGSSGSRAVTAGCRGRPGDRAPSGSSPASSVPGSRTSCSRPAWPAGCTRPIRPRCRAGRCRRGRAAGSGWPTPPTLALLIRIPAWPTSCGSG
jgi:hypothetical protein